MKKRLSATLALLLSAGLLLTACGGEEPGTGEAVLTEPTESAAPAAAAPDGAETTGPTEAASDPETTTEPETTAEPGSEGTTEEEPTGFTDADLAGVNALLPEGTAPRNADGWIAAAEEAYEKAAATFYKVLFTSDWLELDYDEPGPSPIYTKVTNYETFDDATADFFEVFTKEGFATAPYDRFLEKDGALYAAVEDREKDPSYKGFTVTAISDITDDSVTFVIEAKYPDAYRYSQLTLKYERGDFRVNAFTQPY